MQCGRSGNRTPRGKILRQTTKTPIEIGRTLRALRPLVGLLASQPEVARFEKITINLHRLMESKVLFLYVLHSVVSGRESNPIIYTL